MSCEVHDLAPLQKAIAALKIEDQKIDLVEVLKSLLCNEFVSLLEQYQNLDFSKDEVICMSKICSIISLSKFPSEGSLSPSATSESMISAVDATFPSFLPLPPSPFTTPSPSPPPTPSPSPPNTQDAQTGEGGGRLGQKDLKPRDPFAPLYNIKELSVPLEVQNWFGVYKDRSLDFLREGYVEFSDALGETLVAQRDEPAPVKFMNLYQYLKRLNIRSDLDSVRRCYARIGVARTFKTIRPQQTGTRLSDKAVKDLVQHVQSVWKVWDSGRFKIDWDEAATKLSLYCKLGVKLDDVCEELGDGCIFYLSHKLTDNWLEKQFTKGKYYRPAMDLLKAKLDEVDQEERELLNRLGSRIKRFLTMEGW